MNTKTARSMTMEMRKIMHEGNEGVVKCFEDLDLIIVIAAQHGFYEVRHTIDDDSKYSKINRDQQKFVLEVLASNGFNCCIDETDVGENGENMMSTKILTINWQW